MVESGRTETVAERADALERAVSATKHLSEDAQKQAMSNVLGGVEQPTQRTANWLWKTVVSGLIAVLVIALIGLVAVIVSGKTPDTMVTVFTAALTGLIGLFAPSPLDKGSSGSSGGAVNTPAQTTTTTTTNG